LQNGPSRDEQTPSLYNVQNKQKDKKKHQKIYRKNIMPPPARLLSRLQVNVPVVDYTQLPNPSKEEEEYMLKRFFNWKCSLCLEGQPLSNPPVEYIEFAKTACLLGAYRAACRDAEQPANNPPLLPPVPVINAMCLAKQTCRDCGAAGSIAGPPNDSAPFLPLVYQLYASITLQDPDALREARERLAKQGIESEEDLQRILTLGTKLLTSSEKSIGEDVIPVAIGYSSNMLEHGLPATKLIENENGEGVYEFILTDIHPERPDRLRAAAGHLVATGLWQQMHRLGEREATVDEILEFAADTVQITAVETAIAESMSGSNSSVDEERIGDLYFCDATYRAARIALATLLDVTSTVLSKDPRLPKRGLALVRPPGHHAHCSRSAGFCVFNSVGAAARLALKTVEKVLIIDWDIHHGDGTETMFYDNDRVLYISIHRFDKGRFYPTTGSANRIGQGKGIGFNVNIPLDGKWFGDSDYKAIFDSIIMPIAKKFSPDLIFVSSGFDAARGDYLGDFDVTPSGYGRMLKSLLSLANGRVVVALEGGYNLASVAASSEALARVLLTYKEKWSHDEEEVEPLLICGDGKNTVRDAALQLEREKRKRLEIEGGIISGGGSEGGGGDGGDAFEIDMARELGPGAIRESTKRAIELVKSIHQEFWKFD
jgi:acetoin utilization deacetylase AcuC-like enzyme